jgi:hypothetical protein
MRTREPLAGLAVFKTDWPVSLPGVTKPVCHLTWSFASLRYPSIPLVSPPITDPMRTHLRSQIEVSDHSLSRSRRALAVCEDRSVGDSRGDCFQRSPTGNRDQRRQSCPA